MNEPSRKRIVINLDQSRASQPGKQRTRLWPKILALFVVLAVLVLAIAAMGGYLWWRHYQTTPAYSLALILDAAQRDDMAAFDRQIDTEEIAKNMVESFRQK